MFSYFCVCLLFVLLLLVLYRLGIAIEGFMSLLAGWSGTWHATSTFGGNIGAIGITRVCTITRKCCTYKMGTDR